MAEIDGGLFQSWHTAQPGMQLLLLFALFCLASIASPWSDTAGFCDEYFDMGTIMSYNMFPYSANQRQKGTESSENGGFGTIVTKSHPTTTDGPITEANTADALTTSFWVHLKFVGNSIDYNNLITPTLRFVLIDANENRCNIEAFRCQKEGNLGSNEYYSAWAIDDVSSTGPEFTEWINYHDYLGSSRSIPAWYPVSVPVGFIPAFYIAGFNTYLPFTFSITPPPPIAPTITATSPASGATGVALNSIITATFSKAMNASTINTTTFKLNSGITGTVSYNTTTKTATFTPSAPLSANTNYTATITTGVKDSTGTAMAANKSWSFTTTSIPPTNILFNDDFEAGTTGWTEISQGGYNIISTNGSHSHAGSGYAWLGGYADGLDTIFQDIAIPADATTVNTSFWYNIATTETSTVAANDVMYLALINPSDKSVIKILSTLSNLNVTDGSWRQSIQFDLSVYRGRTVRLQFIATTNEANNTNFYVDDVAVSVTGSQQRTLSVSINGNGSVNSNPVGIACASEDSGFCSHQFNNGSSVSLMPAASGDNIFSNWSGCTSLCGNNCLVSMTADKTVQANFVASPHVRIPGVGGFNSLQSAYDSAPARCTIEALATELPTQNFILNKTKNLTLEGGYNSDYTSNNSGYTTMDGTLTIGTGSLTIENLIIQ